MIVSRLKKRVLTFLAISFCTMSALALPSPIDVLQSKADQIIAELQKNKADLRSNPNVSYQIVNRYLVPMVDQNAMAQAVLGRNIWNSATSSQRTVFIQEFRKLVVRTYASAIAQFSNEKVQFMPLRGELNASSPITVKSQIVREDAPNVPVSYTLVLVGNNWKVIDFAVDGISMIQSFKSQFQTQLSSGGLENLIQALKVHNQKNG